mgnify:CR=1 FL=1
MEQPAGSAIWRNRNSGQSRAFFIHAPPVCTRNAYLEKLQARNVGLPSSLFRPPWSGRAIRPAISVLGRFWLVYPYHEESGCTPLIPILLLLITWMKEWPPVTIKPPWKNASVLWAVTMDGQAQWHTTYGSFCACSTNNPEVWLITGLNQFSYGPFWPARTRTRPTHRPIHPMPQKPPFP